MIFRFAACLLLCAVGTLSQPARAANDVQCDIQWEGGIKSAKNVAKLRGFLSQCGRSKHAVDARKRIADLAPPPPPPPQLTRCDVLWSTASRSNLLRDWANYKSSCASHKNYAEGVRNEQQARAEQERLKGELTEQALLREQQSQAEQVRLQEQQARKKLDTELGRWGLNFQDLCGMDQDSLYSKARVKDNLAPIAASASNGDSVAQLLLGFDSLYNFYRYDKSYRLYEPSKSLSAIQKTFERSANGGNPRAMAELASLLLITKPGDAKDEAAFAMANQWIDRSAKMKCGDGLDWQSLLKKTEGERLSIAQMAVDFGSGNAACTLARVYRSDPKKYGGLLAKAAEFGDSCGEYLRYRDILDNPTASNIQKENAGMLLNKLAENGNRFANYYTYDTYVKRQAGRSDGVEALPYLRRSAENGYPFAMVWLARSISRGDYGLAVDHEAAIDWCNRAYQLGSAYGAACKAMYVPDYKRWMDNAYSDKGCEVYYISSRYFPRYFLDELKTEGDLKKRMKNLTRKEIEYLRKFLPQIKYGMSLYSISNADCSSSAKSWIRLIRDVIEPAVS